jgi:RNA polymerase sigma-70 factor (ECF subfamily)
MDTVVIDQDQELIERARQGERLALTQLTNKHRARVYTLINRMINDPSRAEELAMEAFIRAFKNLKTFRGDAKFSSWLYRIAVNTALAERTKKRLDLVSLDSIQYLPADQSAQPDHVYQGLFCSNVVDEALNQLPAHYAMALRLFYLRGVGYVEIAELMRIPIGTVKTYLHRGKRALRETITGKYSPEELL